MHIFRRPDYRSNATQFLEQLHKNDPNLSQRQKTSHIQSWGEENAPDTEDKAQNSKPSTNLEQSGYVYLTQPFTQA